MDTQVIETVDIDKATKTEQEAPPGLLEIRFYTVTPLDDEDAKNVYDYLLSTGADVRRVYVHSGSGLPYLGVVYNKLPPTEGIAFLPLAVVPLVAFGLTTALVGIGIFKLEDITRSLTKLLLITFGGFIALALITRKPMEAASRKYLEG